VNKADQRVTKRSWWTSVNVER